MGAIGVDCSSSYISSCVAVLHVYFTYSCLVFGLCKCMHGFMRNFSMKIPFFLLLCETVLWLMSLLLLFPPQSSMYSNFWHSTGFAP